MIIQTVKKVIAKFICNRYIGSFIALLFKNNIPYFNSIKINTNNNSITPYIKSMIFWRLYESAEARSVIKYINVEHDVIELGSSIGAISTLAGKFKGNKKLVCVEVNPELIPTIKQNLIQNNIMNFSIQNIAIGKSDLDLWFSRGSHNSHGKVLNFKTENAVQIKSISLKQLLEIEKIVDFKLICDIEGSEIDILLSEPESLSNCKTLIIETHKVNRNGVTYTPEVIKKRIIELGFSCIEEYDVNYVFTRLPSI